VFSPHGFPLLVMEDLLLFSISVEGKGIGLPLSPLIYIIMAKQVEET
jgi:hypothetical protein